MSFWLECMGFVAALLGGFLAGWNIGSMFRLTMPNVMVTVAVLIAGSLGGPVVTFAWLGPGVWSFAVALLVAGAAAGLTFWPMGQTQGTGQ